MLENTPHVFYIKFNKMVKRTFFIAALAMISLVTYAQKAKKDSIKMVRLQELQVTSTRANRTTPMSFSDITKKELQKQNTGVDVPFLLSLTPSVTTSSDAGTGIGYTAIHVRGTDPSRINVTANNIPINDSESSQIYWVNMNDFTSSVSSIQIQRGVGTSTNGAGAFGATINMQTDAIDPVPYFSLNTSAGSYGTHKETVTFGSGLLGQHWGINGRLSDIGSDGYIDRASARLNSYFLQGGYYGANTSVKFITFNGQERTYHAWDYATKEDMAKYGRSYNPCGIYEDSNGNTQYYKNQIDFYHQQHYQLIWNQIFSDALNLNVALHYTHGHGYYEQMKDDTKLANYGLSDNSKIKSDLIRRKIMDNDFYGTVYSLNYKHNKVTASFGGGWNKYDGDHYGTVIWAENVAAKWSPDFEYYRNNAKKIDGNVYGKMQYDITSSLNAYVDLQYRHVNYKLQNPADWYTGAKGGKYIYNNDYDFFNPKAGLYYQINRNHSVYASYAVAHREPTRNNYENLTSDETLPKAEKLNDWEIGYKYQSAKFSAGVNGYYMSYDNQFVLTGTVNSIGEFIVRNIKDSYRAGVELTAGWQPVKCFRWDANATFSKNTAKDFEAPSVNQKTVQFGNTHLSYSPNIIFNNIFTFNYKGLEASLSSQYIGKQYMTNTDDENCVLDAYFVSNLNVDYTFRLKGFKSITVGATVYNLFDEEYESNGYAEVGFNDDRSENYNYVAYSAQAPIHFMAHLSLNF